jgi:hypothetical protein
MRIASLKLASDPGIQRKTLFQRGKKKRERERERLID